MSVTIEDLKPKPFKVTVRGVELECRPVRLSHTLILAKIGNIFENASTVSTEEIKQSEKDINELFAELIPELKGIDLDIGSTMELIQQIMDQVEPADNKELDKKGVKFDTDPKAPRTG
ncbi:MAG: hypothetical protein DRR04_10395 [Gammaproteobacteria bacterium]|nr:MAG: hypothetical protein DRR04_10395 [Gammaproteobacteria bacterium]